jgi:hypothetical protein
MEVTGCIFDPALTKTQRPPEVEAILGPSPEWFQPETA